MTYKKCLWCNKQYTVHPKAPHRKYCSNRCRINAWKIRQPGRQKQLQQQWRVKQKGPLCKLCGQEIPKNERKHGVSFCSEKCRRKKQSINTIKSRKKKHKKFVEYKIKRGCDICGYNTFGGSLDFHHIDPQTKTMRIEAKHFVSNSKKIKKELDKCILVCKNCHYELHNLLLHNINEYNTIISTIKKKAYDV